MNEMAMPSEKYPVAVDLESHIDVDCGKYHRIAKLHQSPDLAKAERVASLST